MPEYRALRERIRCSNCAGRRSSPRRSRCSRSAARGRRGDSVFRSAPAARADGHPLRFHPRRRARDRGPDCGLKPISPRSGRFEPRDRSRLRPRGDSAQSNRSSTGRVPLIGFAGAPFTLASYAIEGGHSNNFAHTKALMYGHPDGVAALLRRCSPISSSDYLVAQIEAGVDAVQVFDSWVGALERARLPRVHPAAHAPHLRNARGAIGVPTIHFGVGTGAILAEICGRRRRRDRRRLAHAARRRLGAHRLRSRGPGQPRSDAAARPARSRCSRRPTMCSHARPGGRAHLQPRATGSCR